MTHQLVPKSLSELITPWEKNTSWLWFHNSHFCLYNWSQPFDLVGQMTTAISIEDVRREVKILKALSGHSNLVKFYDACEDALNVYIIMEYVFPLASAYHWSNKCKILWIFARAILKLYVWLCSKVILSTLGGCCLAAYNISYRRIATCYYRSFLSIKFSGKLHDNWCFLHLYWSGFVKAENYWTEYYPGIITSREKNCECHYKWRFATVLRFFFLQGWKIQWRGCKNYCWTDIKCCCFLPSSGCCSPWSEARGLWT